MYESSSDAALTGGLMAALGVYWFVMMVVLVVIIVAQWKIYTKAGKPGWASIIPIYNIIVLLEIVGRPIWWFFLMLIPFVNVIILIIVYNDLSKSFGKGVGYTLGLLFLSVIFFPMLAFGSSRYVGPGGVAAAGAMAPPAAPVGYAPPPPPVAAPPAAPIEYAPPAAPVAPPAAPVEFAPPAPPAAPSEPAPPAPPSES
jgi:hypothetical protein